MKIISIAAGIALALSANVVTAQENPGGDNAVNSSFGGLNKSTFAAGAVGFAVLAGVVSNNRGSIAPAPAPGPGPDPDPACDGDDPLVDGVCTGTTSTVTVTASGTGTTTISVPVTFTYLPSV
jgi:hypothetical protein